VTQQGFVLFQTDRNIIFLCLVMHKNTSIHTGVGYVCNTLSVIRNKYKLVWPE